MRTIRVRCVVRYDFHNPRFIGWVHEVSRHYLAWGRAAPGFVWCYEPVGFGTQQVDKLILHQISDLGSMSHRPRGRRKVASASHSLRLSNKSSAAMTGLRRTSYSAACFERFVRNS